MPVGLNGKMPSVNMFSNGNHSSTSLDIDFTTIDDVTDSLVSGLCGYWNSTSANVSKKQFYSNIKIQVQPTRIFCFPIPTHVYRE